MDDVNKRIVGLGAIGVGVGATTAYFLQTLKELNTLKSIKNESNKTDEDSIVINLNKKADDITEKDMSDSITMSDDYSKNVPMVVRNKKRDIRSQKFTGQLQKNSQDRAPGMWDHYYAGLAGITGLVGGYTVVDKLINRMRKKQIEAEIDAAKNEYITNLNDIKEAEFVKKGELDKQGFFGELGAAGLLTTTLGATAVAYLTKRYLDVKDSVVKPPAFDKVKRIVIKSNTPAEVDNDAMVDDDLVNDVKEAAENFMIAVALAADIESNGNLGILKIANIDLSKVSKEEAYAVVQNSIRDIVLIKDADSDILIPVKRSIKKVAQDNAESQGLVENFANRTVDQSFSSGQKTEMLDKILSKMPIIKWLLKFFPSLSKSTFLQNMLKSRIEQGIKNNSVVSTLDKGINAGTEIAKAVNPLLRIPGVGSTIGAGAKWLSNRAADVVSNVAPREVRDLVGGAAGVTSTASKTPLTPSTNDPLTPAPVPGMVAQASFNKISQFDVESLTDKLLSLEDQQLVSNDNNFDEADKPRLKLLNNAILESKLVERLPTMRKRVTIDPQDKAGKTFAVKNRGKLKHIIDKLILEDKI